MTLKKNFKGIILIAVVGAMLSVTACSTQTTAQEANNETSVAVQEHEGEHLDYDKQGEWEFSAGKMQSPINIVASSVQRMAGDSGTIELDYKTTAEKVENNGHSIEVTDSGTALINGRNFELKQFHFHAESEHTIDGKSYPLEAHFVHKAQDGRIAVIGVFFKEGEENKGFQEVLDDLEKEKTDPIVDINTMMPDNKNYYHYLGSLTTPPLEENVEWYVMSTPVSASTEQIETFKKLYRHNNREPQPLNERVILEHVE